MKIKEAFTFYFQMEGILREESNSSTILLHNIVVIELPLFFFMGNHFNPSNKQHYAAADKLHSFSQQPDKLLHFLSRREERNKGVIQIR